MFVYLFCKTIMTTNSTCSYHIMRKNGARYSCVWMHAPIINYALKSELAIMLRLQLCSTWYTTLQMCKKLLCMNPVATDSVTEGIHNAHPKNQLLTEQWGGYYTPFVAMLCLLHTVYELKCKKFLCNEPKSLWKMQEKSITKLVGSYIAVSQINTLRCQWKEPKHKGGQK